MILADGEIEWQVKSHTRELGLSGSVIGGEGINLGMKCSRFVQEMNKELQAGIVSSSIVQLNGDNITWAVRPGRHTQFGNRYGLIKREVAKHDLQSDIRRG